MRYALILLLLYGCSSSKTHFVISSITPYRDFDVYYAKKGPYWIKFRDSTDSHDMGDTFKIKFSDGRTLQ